LLALLAAPILWSTTPLQSGDAGLPFAGPELMQPTRGQDRNDLGHYTGLVNYLQANHGGEMFIVAGSNANTVAPLILLTGKPGMAIGGFTGSDPILTVDEFSSYVQEGKLRFVLVDNERRGGREIMQWVQTTCRMVDPWLWQGTSNISTGLAPGGPDRMMLYDCR
jgi:4-amino-4-deoxy-L-arabinose transferase-like glycosyltransferase